MSSFLAPILLFKNAAVAPLLVSRIISSASVGFGQIALTWGVLAMEYGPRDLSIVLACNAFPALLIVFGGLVGDRYRRHHVLITAELLACGSWIALGTAFWTGDAPLTVVCLFAAMGGIATALFMPTLRGIVADLLRSDDRPAGNALVNQTQSVGLLVGLVSSGVVVTVIGPAWAAAARGILCGISALVLSRLSTPRPTLTRTGFVTDMRVGWREFVRYPWVWIMTLQYMAVTTALMCYAKIAGPLYANDGNGGAYAWGIISAAEPLGALAGALIGARRKPGRGVIATALLPTSAAAPMALMSGGAPWPTIALAALLPGTLLAIYYVRWTTTLQEQFPSHVLIRVNSWNIIASYSIMPLSLVLSGPIVAHLGPQAIALASAMLTIVATLLTLLILRPVAHKPTELPVIARKTLPSSGDRR
ncbi:MFS transporter [Actinomadura sp. SCN-SB]|uniref:MFS transporter n=1 Tax=Actinomadura sp. SCN-SB TaxID=3373092 RepID=UPI00375384C9